MWSIYIMVLSLWQPGHNCLGHMKFEVFMHFGGSISLHFLTRTNVIGSFYGVITLTAWSQLLAAHWLQCIYRFGWLSFTQLCHKDYQVSFSHTNSIHWINESSATSKKEVNFRGDGHFDWLILQTNISNILWCYYFDRLVTTAKSRWSLRYLCLLVAEFHCTF